MNRGEIWLVQLDVEKSVGHEYYHDRPALVLVATKLIGASEVITVMPLTSSQRFDEDDILVTKSGLNGLYKDSVIKVRHITSYDKSRFLHKLGLVDEEVMEEIDSYLRKHFDL